jgi:hypothetical protein
VSIDRDDLTRGVSSGQAGDPQTYGYMVLLQAPYSRCTAVYVGSIGSLETLRNSWRHAGTFSEVQSVDTDKVRTMVHMALGSGRRVFLVAFKPRTLRIKVLPVFLFWPGKGEPARLTATKRRRSLELFFPLSQIWF